MVSKYLIYMAAFVFSMSEASLINLATSTSALAEIILDSANLYAFGAFDSDVYNSSFIYISLIKTCSKYNPLIRII